MPKWSTNLKIVFILLTVTLILLGILKKSLKSTKNSSQSLTIKTAAVPDKKSKKDKKVIKLLFAGDMMFDRNIRLAAKKEGNYNFIFDDIRPLLLKENIVIANLEGPITSNKSLSIYSRPGEKRNFIFTFSPQVAAVLGKNNIRIVNLGNNHVLNFGSSGLKETITILKKNNIRFFGQPGEKNNFLIKNFAGYKIAFLNYNQFDKESLQRIFRQLKDLKNKVNFIIVYNHWGTEYQTKANKTEVKLAHSFINAGADLVIGSHPHVIQNKEIYKGKRIYYSLGNFVFDQYFSAEVRQGLVVQLKIQPSSNQVSYNEFYVFLKKDGKTTLEKSLNF